MCVCMCLHALVHVLVCAWCVRACVCECVSACMLLCVCVCLCVYLGVIYRMLICVYACMWCLDMFCYMQTHSMDGYYLHSCRVVLCCRRVEKDVSYNKCTSYIMYSKTFLHRFFGSISVFCFSTDNCLD